MKYKILIIIGAIFFINCKGQEKEKQKESKNTNLTLENSTFLGVNKKDGKYYVLNRCDGGYPVLRFKKDVFYFYNPQEGINYIIKNIKKTGNKFVINTSGYYFIEGENVIKKNEIWYLEKNDSLVWTFKNTNWNKNIILSDSLNIIRNKIVYKVQPCKECYDDCDDQIKDNKLVGNWAVNCESPIGINIKNNELVITVEPNQYYIHLSKIKEKSKTTFKYKLKQFEGLGSKEIYSETYFNENEIAIVKVIDNNKIEFNWLGFYNKVNNERQCIDPLISNDNPVILNRCEE